MEMRGAGFVEIPSEIAMMGIAGWRGATAHEGWLVPGGMTVVCGAQILAKKDKYHIDDRPRFTTISASW
jgi:hypothetical protein